jgi:hypothetical protein
MFWEESNDDVQNHARHHILVVDHGFVWAVLGVENEPNASPGYFCTLIVATPELIPTEMSSDSAQFFVEATIESASPCLMLLPWA